MNLIVINFVLLTVSCAQEQETTPSTNDSIVETVTTITWPPSVVHNTTDDYPDNETTTVTTTTVTTTAAPSTEAEPNGIKTIPYCSATELHTEIRQVEYSWVISDILGYLGRLAELRGGKKPIVQPVQFGVHGLKFYENEFFGNWSVSLAEEPSGATIICMTYEMDGDESAEHVMMDGVLFMYQPTFKGQHNSPTKYGRPKTKILKKHEINHSHIVQSDPENGDQDHQDQDLIQLCWTGQHKLEQLGVEFKKKWDKQTMSSPKQPAPMIMPPRDELSFLFNVTVVKKLPDQIAFVRNCISPEHRGEMSNGHRSTKTRFSYSTLAPETNAEARGKK